ncbi:glutamyl-tRNA synthetase [Schizosaccharomyces cryophilus OY26]|uniref:glutamate--tRNA ligase n=1 Tax=Schizosaccharomyces cryophilus (strain OY26 / ATCC MYA-4695 / CBS 11777 / NBRC 106824 / NRRL Y48691) TaxID=653667 RepID=S9W466_SCHCR|nr:glutamyl-tRNA synthetase [Schizosaccharomyces cryophilus OY26]EPY52800.1 glutamyl-tRNA synthetase [Schizosaccharomyces cryophilus OY26]
MLSFCLKSRYACKVIQKPYKNLKTLRWNSTTVRTRFAPSPTGFLHLGSLRTALFNYLWAKKCNGKFIVRLEDTDQKRKVNGSEQSIYDLLQTFGLQWDEGPITGGPFGPYEQSKRLHIYSEYISKLLASGKAYKCYDECSTQSPKTDKNPYVVRFRSEEGPITFVDTVYGKITIKRNTPKVLSDDFVLLKSDGYPTYHFANVVDDHLMGITNVIRGEEWIPSTPKHIQLYKAFHWRPPTYSHIPLLTNPDGSKLSKRQNDAHVTSLLEKGFEPMAILNFLALMGWSSRQKNDVIPLPQLLELFSIDRLTRGSCIVALEKLQFLNKHYLRERMTDPKQLEQIVAQMQKSLKEKYPNSVSRISDSEYVCRCLLLLHNRVRTLPEFVDLCGYFFEEPSQNTIQHRMPLATNVSVLLSRLLHEFQLCSWQPQVLQTMVSDVASSFGIPLGKLQSLIRQILCGSVPGANLADTIHLLGRDTTLHRLEAYNRTIS